ncbi:hypothetical protein V8E53_013283 [Lactarius tabidus]
MDPNVVRERRVLQLQADTLDNGISDSMVSQSSTPFPGTQCNPPTSLQNKPSRGRCGEIEDSQASTHSSPSHQSAPLAPLSRRHRGRRRCERSQDLRRLPQRVESAPPRVSCPEMSSSEETARKSKAGEHQSKPQSVHQPARKGESADDGDEAHVDDGEWIDVDVGAESIADNLLQLESHSGYVSDPKKRRRRWEHHWEVLLNALHALDRETNTPLMLLAAPSHTGKLHSVTSRAVRRDSSLKSTDMKNIRSSFAGIAFRQQAAHPPSPVEQPSCPRLSSCDEAPSNSNSGREEDLRRALKTAIGGVHALWGLYERQATHLIEAKHKLDEDKEQVQLLLTQMFGVSVC